MLPTIIFAAPWCLLDYTPLPVFMNNFRAMGESSLLAAHPMPWLSITFSLELATIRFFTAFKVIRYREY